MITEREPLVAPGACVQPDRPHPPPSCNPPGFTFPGTRPPGDTVGFQRFGAPVSRYVNAAPSRWAQRAVEARHDDRVRWLQGPSVPSPPPYGLTRLNSVKTDDGARGRTPRRDIYDAYDREK